MKMWSGRFRQPLDPEFEKWQRSFPYDQRLLPFELAASRAHANALEHAGVLSSEELSEIIKSAWPKSAAAPSPQPEFLNDPEAEDVHHFVEKQLAALIGATGYKLHTGRSRNEQIATDLRLFVRHSIDTSQNLIADWIEAISRAELTRLAAPRCRRTLICNPPSPSSSRTGCSPTWKCFCAMPPAWPIAASASISARWDQAPLPEPTLTINRRAMAAELDFDGPTANSIDATSDRDFVIEFVDALSLLALHLSRWAEEMILFSTSAYGFVELPEAYSTGSSAMPQKKNPDLLELVRGKAARVMGCATTLQTLVKGLPLAYNKDLQETQEPLFNAADTIIGMLPLVTGFMNRVEFNEAKMNQAAQTGFMNAWAAAAYLVERGVPSRLAHEAVGKAVALAVERGCDLQKLPLADLQAIHSSFDAAFHSSLGVTEVLALHDVPGGTAPRYVKRALQNARERAALLRSQESLAAP